MLTLNKTQNKLLREWRKEVAKNIARYNVRNNRCYVVSPTQIISFDLIAENAVYDGNGNKTDYRLTDLQSVLDTIPRSFTTPIQLDAKQAVEELKALGEIVSYIDGHWVNRPDKSVVAFNAKHLIQVLSCMQEPVLYDSGYTGQPVEINCPKTGYNVILSGFIGTNPLSEDLMWSTHHKGYTYNVGCAKKDHPIQEYDLLEENKEPYKYQTDPWVLAEDAYKRATNTAFLLRWNVHEFVGKTLSIDLWVTTDTHKLSFCNGECPFLQIVEKSTGNEDKIWFDSREEMNHFAEQFLNLIQK